MFGLDGSAAVGLMILMAFYILPGLIAALRHHHNTLAIGALNLLLGWTILGWVAALVWALTATPGAPVRSPAPAPEAAAALVPPPPWPATVRPDPPRHRKLIALALIILLICLAWWTWAEAALTCRTTYDKTFDRWVTRCADGRQYQSRYDRTFDRWLTRPLPPWKPLEKPRR